MKKPPDLAMRGLPCDSFLFGQLSCQSRITPRSGTTTTTTTRVIMTAISLDMSKNKPGKNSKVFKV